MKELNTALRAHRAVDPAPADADAFWSDFQRRAAGVERVPRVATTGPLARAASVVAALALMAGAGLWAVLPGAAHAGVRIDALAIPADHDSVFIINDAAGEGTIIVIGGLQPQDSRRADP